MPDLPLESMKYHNFEYKSEIPEITIECCRRYIRHMNAILRNRCMPMILAIAQMFDVNQRLQDADIIWGSGILDIYSPNNVLHVYTENGENISYIVLANTDQKRGYIIYYDRMPCVFAM